MVADPTLMCELLVGLGEVDVLGVEEWSDGSLWMTVLYQVGMASMRPLWGEGVVQGWLAGESTGEFGVERPREVADTGAVWRWVRGLAECNGKAAMAGHSSGAYILCRVALEVGQPDAAVLQGALYRSIADLFRYNGGLVLDYMRLGAEQAAWVREHSPKTYEDALMLEATAGAIENGDSIAEAEIDGVTRTRDLSSLRYDLEFAPEDQFRHLAAPTLVLHASEDLNVPVEDAFDTVLALWAAGNRDVELRILPAGNHSFQFDAEDYETRVQEKITKQNFARPFDPLYPAIVIDYLARRLACPGRVPATKPAQASLGPGIVDVVGDRRDFRATGCS